MWKEHNQEAAERESSEEKCANMVIDGQLARENPVQLLTDVFFDDKGQYEGRPPVVLRGLGPAERKRMHRAVEKTELDSLSVYDCGERVLVIGATRDVSRKIGEINARNGRASIRLPPR